MAPIRVLLVDDAVVIRRLLTDILQSDPEIEVVGVAANGRIALGKLAQVQPDVVVLDVEMPEMNGLETLAALRKTHPRLPVIMFSTLTERGAVTTLDALSLGATDYITKPANVGSVVLARKRVQDELIPKIRLLTGRGPKLAPVVVRPKVAAAPRVRPSGAVEVVGIGVSTGGPNALAALLPAIPEQFPAPILVVQHMPPLFTRFLAERLAGKSRIGVVEGADGMVVRPGTAYIAPGDFHMTVERHGLDIVLRMNQAPPENSCRPAVDVLFRSIAAMWGNHALVAVLTGMGQDGMRGAERVREAGGQILAQDEATSVVWGMPGYVANAGLADRVLPLDEMAREIVTRTTNGALGALAR